MFRRSVTVAAVVLGITALAGPASAHHKGEEAVPTYTVEVAGQSLTTPTVTSYEGHGEEHTADEVLLECLAELEISAETVGCPPE